MKTRTRKEVYELWIKALKSDEYNQGTGMLRIHEKNKISFCCLGVLCDLAARDGGRQWTSSNPYDQMANKGHPPFNIVEFMGFFEIDDTATRRKAMGFNPNDETDLVCSNLVIEKLVRLNDTDDASFEQIAGYIETKIMPKVCN